MNKKIGRVQHIDNDYHAWVLVERTGACVDCSQHHGCCTLVDGQNRMLLKVKNVLVDLAWLMQYLKVNQMQKNRIAITP